MKLLEEYKKNSEKHEDFLEWFLVKKISFMGKIFFISVLWILFLIFGFNLRFMVFFFEFIVISLIIYFILKLCIFIFKKFFEK
ncbi:hypothetical protein ACWODG_12165 [Enterococcus italicus]